MEKPTYTYKLRQIIFYLFIWTSLTYSQNFNGGFNFYIPPFKAIDSRFMPQFPKDPIGDDAFVYINADGHFALKNNRIKFWGVNLVANSAFPENEYTNGIADRLNSFGYNLVRFHHIDNPWALRSLFDYGGDTRHLNISNLDKIEKMIYSLKRNGIYINMNLHVSRTFTETDGVANADSIKMFGKGVVFFDPQLIELQKEYAQQLLTHINPYTGLALVDDPVMAMLEITNENSLYKLWVEDNLVLQSEDGILIHRHNELLNSLWHIFLQNKYLNTDRLRQYWYIGIINGDNNNIVNGDFETPPINNNWHVSNNAYGNIEIALDSTDSYNGDYCEKVSVSNTDGTDWHTQFMYKGLTLEKDSSYTTMFWAKSDFENDIVVILQKENDPWTIYDRFNCTVTDQWQKFSFITIADEDVESEVRLSFLLGKSDGNYKFDDVYFGKRPLIGLTEEEDLKEKNILRIDYDNAYNYTQNRVKDITEFLIKIQNDYYGEMKSFLINDLGVKVPIVGTNWNWGFPDLAVQSKLDYIDNHAYWDHPNFPNKPYSKTHWYIENMPMVKAAQSWNPITYLMSGIKYRGKPYTISEYNNIFPNKYQSEGVLFISAYSSFHDVDGIMFFDYNNSLEWTDDYINSFFNIHNNPVMMSLMPSCGFVYRNELISKANKTIKISVSEEDVLTTPISKINDYSKTLSLQHAIVVDTFNSDEPLDYSHFPSAPTNPYITDTGEITWDNVGLLKIVTPKYLALTGDLPNFIDENIGIIKLLDANDFGSLTWLSLTNYPLQNSNLSLITLASKVQNSGMVWDGITTVHDNWGTAPTQIFPLDITFQVKINADSIRIYPLNPDGEDTDESILLFPQSENQFMITLDQVTYNTVWFGIEAYGDSVLSIEKQTEKNQDFELSQNFPNPFNPKTIIKYQLPIAGKVEFSVYNILGKKIETMVNQQQEAGSYTITFDASELSSGVYFYKLTVGNFQKMRKMLVVK